MEMMLDFDELTRLSAAEALAHPYLKTYADIDDEPIASIPFDISFEDETRDMNAWKSKLLNFSNVICRCKGPPTYVEISFMMTSTTFLDNTHLPL